MPTEPGTMTPAPSVTTSSPQVMPPPQGRSSRPRQRLGGIGDSISTFIAGGIILQRAANKGGKYRIDPAHILGVGGTRTDQILATVPTVLALPVGLVMVNGGTNDIAQSTGVGRAKGNLMEIWRQLRAGGVDVVDLGMLPNDVSNARAKAHADLQFWRQLYCAREGIAHCNVWPLLAAPTGGFDTGKGSDTVHPSALGVDLAGTLLQQVLDNPRQASPFGALLDETTDPNGLLCRNAVSFGGVGSAVPGGWFALGSGAAYSVEAPVDGSFGNWLTATYTAPGTNVGFQGTGQNMSTLGWSKGDRIAIGCRVRSTGCTPGSMKVDVLMNNAGAGGGFLTFQEDQVNGLDQWLYTEAVLGDGPTVAFNARATVTGTGPQKLSIQRPILFNMTKAGL